MPLYTITDPDGRAIRYGQAPDPADQAGPGDMVHIGINVDGNSLYWNGSAWSARPQMAGIAVDKAIITADGEDEAVITGLPEGAEVYLGSSLIGTVDAGGDIVFTTEMLGLNRLRIELWPFQTYHVDIRGA